MPQAYDQNKIKKNKMLRSRTTQGFERVTAKNPQWTVISILFFDKNMYN